MSWISECVAGVSKRAADVASSTGLADIGVVRKAGVFVMDRVVPDRDVEIRVVDGIRMVVNPEADGRWYYFADQGRTFGGSEGGNETRLPSLLSPGDVMLDVGAHIGYMSLLGRHYVGDTGTVVAFEPLPSNFEKLQHNVDLNGFENVRTERAAVSDERGKLTIHQGDKSIRATAVEGMFEGTATTSVESTTIDEYVSEHGLTPDLVKINAEGVEYEVLRGMKSTIRTARPTIAVEVHPTHLQTRDASAERVVSLLLDEGYSISTDEPLSESTARELAAEASRPFNIVAE